MVIKIDDSKLWFVGASNKGLMAQNFTPESLPHRTLEQLENMICLQVNIKLEEAKQMINCGTINNFWIVATRTLEEALSEIREYEVSKALNYYADLFR